MSRLILAALLVAGLVTALPPTASADPQATAQAAVGCIYVDPTTVPPHVGWWCVVVTAYNGLP